METRHQRTDDSAADLPNSCKLVLLLRAVLPYQLMAFWAKTCLCFEFWARCRIIELALRGISSGDRMLFNQSKQLQLLVCRHGRAACGKSLAAPCPTASRRPRFNTTAYALVVKRELYKLAVALDTTHRYTYAQSKQDKRHCASRTLMQTHKPSEWVLSNTPPGTHNQKNTSCPGMSLTVV